MKDTLKVGERIHIIDGDIESWIGVQNSSPRILLASSYESRFEVTVESHLYGVKDLNAPKQPSCK